MTVIPYLSFDGDCAAAFAFYAELLGGEVTMMTYAEMPADPDMPMLDEAERSKIMHAELRAANHALMGSDMIALFGGYQKPQGMRLVIGAADFAEGERLFEALAAGGEVEMPFAPTFFSAGFGQVRDRFGIVWAVDVAG